jgi:hypothetical protein
MSPRVLNALVLSVVVAAAYLAYVATRIYGFDLYMEEFGPERTMRVARVSTIVLFGVTFASSMVGGSIVRAIAHAPVFKTVSAGLLCFLLGGPLFDLVAGITADAIIRTTVGILVLVWVVGSPGFATWRLARRPKPGTTPSNKSLERTREG